ncbi:Arm DNA-binding domain-containing protein [Novosphingobium sp. TH158]|uniref:Arm DNA-binding domain-containing protein n=1 Tax=Novosphingobium sp. TH158 TaxID=2067455 RepID=UPI000C7A8DDC|nr:Arm DNA-binding domain-containing protein [Novosphingobium sp. TH158]PLK27701.1 hypothetical protein C0V78_13005 [Novosphingobium sp. TH158]
MSLKATQISAFAVTDKTYRKSDEKGLYLEIRPNGSKLWFLKYRIAGKEKRLGLGAWPDVTLAQARERRDEARRLIKSGTDPLQARKLSLAQWRSHSVCACWPGSAHPPAVC